MLQNIHLVFEIASYFIGYRIYLYLRKKEVDLLTDENRVEIFVVACFGAMVGSKLLGVLEDVSIFKLNIFSIIQILLGTKTIVGGLLGGLFSVEIFKKLKGIKYSSGDLMTFPLIIGVIIGRIGCHLTALEDGTFGIETHWVLGMDFGDGIYRHPTNLYEIVFLLCIGLIIYFLEIKFILSNGSKFRIFLSSYFLFRFFIDFLKPRILIFGEISTIQIACLAGLCYYCYIFLTTKTFLDQYD